MTRQHTGRMVAWGGTPVGATLGGVIADSYGVATAWTLLTFPVVLGLAILLLSPVRRLR